MCFARELTYCRDIRRVSERAAALGDRDSLACVPAQVPVSTVPQPELAMRRRSVMCVVGMYLLKGPSCFTFP